MTLSKRGLLAAVVAARAVALVPCVRGQGAPERRSLTIAVGGKPAFYYLPLTIAEQLRFFAAEGLDISIVDFAGGAKALQAVVGGSADICSGAYEHTISLQSKGQYYSAFVLQGRAPQISLGVSTRTLAGYRTITDLRGKKIGVSAPGSSTNMIANYVLAQGGVKPDEVSFIGVGASAGALAFLRGGQIDAISNTDPIMTMLEQSGDIKIIADTRTLAGTRSLFGGSMPAGCLYAAADFVNRNPATTQALANAIVRALQWLRTAGPSEIINTVPNDYLLGDRALYLASYAKVRDAISPDGVVPDDGPRTALKALASFDSTVRADAIDLSRTFTNTFARRAARG